MKDWLLKKRWRIILAGILIMAIPLVTLAIYLHFSVQMALKERITEELKTVAQLGAHTLETKLHGDIAFGRSYASRPRFLEGVKKVEKEEMDKRLRNLMEISDSMERAFVTDPKGVQLANYPETPETLGRDFSDRDWYKGVSRNWAPYVSEFYMRMASPQRDLFAIAIPMESDGKVIGILVMQPKEDYIKNALGDIDAGRKGHAYVVDKKGNLVYHPELTIDTLVDLSDNPAVQNVMKGMEGVEKTICHIDNRPSISAYHPVTEWSWGVIVETPGEVVFAPERRISLWTAGITGLMLLLGGIIAYYWTGLLASSVKAEAALRESEHKLRDVLSSIEETVEERTSELLQIKEHLLRHSRELTVFAESTSVLLMLPSSENVYEAVCDTAARIFELQMAWLGIISENAIASPVAKSGNVADEKAVAQFIWDSASEEDGLSCMAIRTWMPQIIDDILLDEHCRDWKDVAASLDCRSALSLPLVSSESRVIGSLNLYHTSPNYFTRDRLETLRIFANYCSFVIEIRWLIEGLEKKVRERTRELETSNSELLMRRQEAEQLKMQAEAANKAKSDFLANMSHELRTPLNSVIGFSEILEDRMYGELNDNQLEYVKDIALSGKHLLKLINDILDLSKVEAGKMELELSRFSLKDVLYASMSMLKEKAMKHRIKLGCEIEPDADIEIEADERKLKQIMYNLLSNAVKFTPDGGNVRVTARRIQDSGFTIQDTPLNPPLPRGEVKGGVHHESGIMHHDGNLVEISVEDIGIGIKPEDIDKLFRPFSQIGSAYTKNFEGTGLGLVLTKRMVELHGGKIWVDSEFGKGSKFSFVISVRQGQVARKE